MEASRDRARVSARVRRWALEAVMGSKKAAHASLNLENANTTALLGENHRDGETLLDPNASVHMRADEWNKIWQRDTVELPHLYQALHFEQSCRLAAQQKRDRY